MVARNSQPFDISVATEGPRATQGVSGTSTNIALQQPGRPKGQDWAALGLQLADQYISTQTTKIAQDAAYLQGQTDGLKKDIQDDSVGFFKRRAYQEGAGRISAVTAVSEMQASALRDMHKAVATGTDPVAYTQQLQENASKVLLNTQNGQWKLNAADHQHVIDNLQQTTEVLSRQYKQVWDGVQVQAQGVAASAAVSQAARNVVNATDADVYKSAGALMSSMDLFTDPSNEYRIPAKDAYNNIEQALKQIALATPANGSALDPSRLDNLAQGVWDSPMYQTKMSEIDRTQMDTTLFALRRDVMGAQAAQAEQTLKQMQQAVQTPEFAGRTGMVAPDLQRADLIVSSALDALNKRLIPVPAYNGILDARNALMDAIGKAGQDRQFLDNPLLVATDAQATAAHSALVSRLQAAGGTGGTQADYQASDALYNIGKSGQNRALVDNGQKGYARLFDGIGAGVIVPQMNPETKQPEYAQWAVEAFQKVREEYISDPTALAGRLSQVKPELAATLMRALHEGRAGTTQTVMMAYRSRAEQVLNGTALPTNQAPAATTLKALSESFKTFSKGSRFSTWVQNTAASAPDLFRGRIGVYQQGRDQAQLAADEDTATAFAEEYQDRRQRYAMPASMEKSPSTLRNFLRPGVAARSPDTEYAPTAPYSVQVERNSPAFRGLGEFRTQFLEAQYKAYRAENPTHNLLLGRVRPAQNGVLLEFHVEHSQDSVLIPMSDEAIRTWDSENRDRIVREQKGTAFRNTMTVLDHTTKKRLEVRTTGLNTVDIAGSEAEQMTRLLMHFEAFRSAPDPKQGGTVAFGFSPKQRGADSLHAKFMALPEDKRTIQAAYDLLVKDPRGISEYYKEAKKIMGELGVPFAARNFQSQGTRELLTYSAYLGGGQGAKAVGAILQRGFDGGLTARQALAQLRETAVWKGANEKSRPFLDAMVIQSITGFGGRYKYP